MLHPISKICRLHRWMLFALFLSSARVADPHALGNFTLNHACVLELTGDRLILHAMVDFAEVPSFEQFMVIDTDDDRVVTPGETRTYLSRLAAEIASGYRLTVNARRVAFELVESTSRLSEGLARVTCLQVLNRWQAPLPRGQETHEVRFENTVYGDRLGRSDIRLAWSPDWDVEEVNAIAQAAGQTLGEAADLPDSVFFDGTRTIRFSARRGDETVTQREPVPCDFAAFDRYIATDMIPPQVLSPDSQGRYEIFHVKLARSIATGASIGASQPSPTTWPSSPEPANGGPARQDDRPRELGDAERKFSELIHSDETGPRALLVMILLSFVYGAAHALSPGHGKTIVAAYLVGTRGNLRRGAFQAVYLGVIVTLSHVFVVLVVGISAAVLTAGALSPRIALVLQMVSGLLVLSIGIPLILQRVTAYFRMRVNMELADADIHHHTHHRPAIHAHTHLTSHEDVHRHGGETHSHHIPSDVNWWKLLILGATGGMVPCAGAVLVFLIGVGYGKIGLGLTLIVAFSVGLATVLIAIGLATVFCKQSLEHTFGYLDARFGKDRGSTQTFFRYGLPILAATLVTLLGLAICIRALLQSGLLVINI